MTTNEPKGSEGTWWAYAILSIRQKPNFEVEARTELDFCKAVSEEEAK